MRSAGPLDRIDARWRCPPRVAVAAFQHGRERQPHKPRSSRRPRPRPPLRLRLALVNRLRPTYSSSSSSSSSDSVQRALGDGEERERRVRVVASYGWSADAVGEYPPKARPAPRRRPALGVRSHNSRDVTAASRARPGTYLEGLTAPGALTSSRPRRWVVVDHVAQRTAPRPARPRLGALAD